MKFVPHEYQMHSLRWLIQRTILDGHAGGAYFLDPGLGKTSTTLAWLRLLKLLGLSKKILIVAPLRVIYSVWPNECRKWDQFTFWCSIVHGSESKRIEALNRHADLYLINAEGIPWLHEHFGKDEFPFDVLVIDESTKFKSWSSSRTKALKKLVPKFKYRLILTGTPSPNGYEDLFSQIFMVDQGECLGTSITKFRTKYFYQGGYGGYEWKLSDGSEKKIETLIEPLCLRLSAKDHLDLPELLTNDVWVELPPTTLKAYRKLEREMFMALDESKEIVVGNAGAKYLACRQVANGGLYDEEKKGQLIHDAKVSAISDLVDELHGKPCLIAFQFRHDLERLRKAFPKVPNIDGSTSGKDTNLIIDKWNNGEIPILAVQPQALSHGINMQSGPGRDIIWMGLTDNLETYLQFNARIHRQGVTGQVRIHRVLASKTVDIVMRDRLESKDQSQSALLEALNKYRGQHAI